MKGRILIDKNNDQYKFVEKDGILVRVANGLEHKNLRRQYMGENPLRTKQNGDLHPDFEGWVRSNYPTKGSGKNMRVKIGNKYYPVNKLDQAHKVDAVKWWNKEGYKAGKKSDTVKDFMQNRDNYTLQPRSRNRSDGGKIRETYRDPHPSTL